MALVADAILFVDSAASNSHSRVVVRWSASAAATPATPAPVKATWGVSPTSRHNPCIVPPSNPWPCHNLMTKVDETSGPARSFLISRVADSIPIDISSFSGFNEPFAVWSRGFRQASHYHIDLDFGGDHPHDWDDWQQPRAKSYINVSFHQYI